MASSRFIQRGNDYSSQFINIDTLIDVLCRTQEKLGEPLMFKEIGGCVEKQSISQTESVENENQYCHHKKKMSALRSGDFSMTMRVNIDDDDDDDDYICDFCAALGYSRKYKPEICDVCKTCESCPQYEDEDCSGCSYSIYRDGTFYRDKLSDDQLFSQEDLRIINSIKPPTGNCAGKRFESEGMFTVRRM